jgi:glycosyltransferase involved in cell wall biosynthesis
MATQLPLKQKTALESKPFDVAFDRSRMSVSVALVTRNRPESLARSLASWRRQSVQPWEIVVSDDSDDSLRPEVQRIAMEFGAVWIPGPRKGLYANRNHAAIHTHGTHVFSADDDHEHPASFMEACLKALEQDPESAWCVGEVHAWEEVAQGWKLPGQLNFSGSSNTPPDTSNSWSWSDGATICPRTVFDSGLRFCESFRFGASYLEFGCLLHTVGIRIRLLETTGVVHHLYEVGRSYHIPVEEYASRYFALLMLGCVYQPRKRNFFLVSMFFLKEFIRRPVALWRPALWAYREMKTRRVWFQHWVSNHQGNFEGMKCEGLKAGG